MSKLDNLCKICRREGEKLFLKGEKCLSPKCPFVRRSYPPGQHGQARRKKISDYAKQLREKQKVKRMYSLSEQQFKNYFKKAASFTGDTEENFIQLLERRLDNTVYRLGLSPSRRAARQMISHRHVLVNKRKLNIPSYLVKPNGKIELAKKPKSFEISKDFQVPSWLKLDRVKLIGTVLHLPKKDETEGNIDLSQIIEFYSK